MFKKFDVVSFSDFENLKTSLNENKKLLEVVSVDLSAKKALILISHDEAPAVENVSESTETRPDGSTKKVKTVYDSKGDIKSEEVTETPAPDTEEKKSEEVKAEA